jgi:hypothetical protein
LVLVTKKLCSPFSKFVHVTGNSTSCEGQDGVPFKAEPNSPPLFFINFQNVNNQSNGTLRSRISIDSLSSEHSSKSPVKNASHDSSAPSSSEDENEEEEEGVTDTMKRNRGPRPAYSDANMQHSLGYLP